VVPGYSHTKNFVSDLASSDSLVRNEMNIFGFLLPGLLIFLFSIGLYKSIASKWSGKLGAILLSLAGISFVSVAFFPANHPNTNSVELHDIISAAPLHLTVISFFFLGYQEVHRKVLDKHWLYMLLFIVTIVIFLTFFYPQLDVTDYGGIVQRITIAIPYLMTATSSIYLYWFEFVRKKS